MSPPQIRPGTFLGLRTDIQGNAHFVTNSEIVYPAGGVLVLHDYEQKKQNFINLSVKQNPIQSISIAANKQFIVVSERGDKQNPKPSLKIYDLTTLKLVKSLIIPFEEINCEEFVAVQFTWDSKYIVAITGEPDWMLYYYNWENGKIESQTKAQNPNGQGKVAQVNCNPSDANVVVVSGPQTFRLMNVSETVWRQWGWTKAENLIITSCMWLTASMVMFGTKNGILMIVENGELKQNCVYKGAEVMEIITKKTDDKDLDVASQMKQDHEASDAFEIRCLTVFPKGFAFSCKIGYVHMFEKESRFKWIKRNVFRIAEEELCDKDGFENLSMIRHIAVNNNEDTLIATTLKSQIYYVKLFEEHMRQVPEIMLKEMGEMLHHGRINGLDVCSWKPIFVTSGAEDMSVRLWNYESMKLEFVKYYHDQINCISLHPTGFFAVIGFVDKLRYMVVLIDDLQQIREFPIRDCKVCKFSNNGHMFAAVSDFIIKVYSSISFDNVFNLKGHGGIIRALSWAGRDDKIVSCGSDGAIYEWCMTTSRRMSEVIMKNNDFTGCSVSSDGKSSYIVGVDGEIKEVRNDLVIRNLKILGIKLDNIILAHSDMMLFVTGGKGNVVSIQFPLLDKAVFSEFHMHNRNVTSIALSYDDRTLISVAEDATMCVWRLEDTDGKAVVLSPDFRYSNEILINKNDLREKLTHITELSKRISEMETEYDYQMRQMTIVQQENLQSLHGSYSNIIKELNDKIEKLEIRHVDETSKLQHEISEIRSENDREMVKVSTDFNSKLIHEYNKYEELQKETAEMRKNYEERLEKLENDRAKALNDTKNDYEMQLNDKNNIIKELIEKNDLEMREHEFIKEVIEDDADREIIELKATYEVQLRKERNTNIVLKGENDTLKKKIIAYQKTIDEYKSKVKQLNAESEQSQDSIKILDAKISELRREINNRDKTISDKEKNIHSVKLENQTLEKYKLVLGFKVEELKKQIKPKDDEITELEEKVADLEQKLNDLTRIKEDLEFEIESLKDRMVGILNENKKQLNKMVDMKTSFKRIKDNIRDLSQSIHSPPQLKDDVKELLNKYASDEDDPFICETDPFCDEERRRLKCHVDFLTRKMRSLNEKLSEAENRFRHENSKLMKHNTILMEEINKLRKDLTTSNEECKRMKTLLGLPAARVSPDKARMMIDKACADYDKMKKEFDERIREKEFIITRLKMEGRKINTEM